MTSTSTPHGPDRRAVLRTAAWATPAVMAASATPAFAASPLRLTVGMGNTALANISGTAYGPKFDGFTITPSKAVAAGDLRVLITAVTPSAETAYLWLNHPNRTSNPVPWTTGFPANTPVITANLYLNYPSAVDAGQTVALSGGVAVVSTSVGATVPAFTLTIQVLVDQTSHFSRSFTHPSA